MNIQLCVSVVRTVFYYLHEGDLHIWDFPDHVTTETMSTMEIWREQFVPVAEELLYKITSYCTTLKSFSNNYISHTVYISVICNYFLCIHDGTDNVATLWLYK